MRCISLITRGIFVPASAHMGVPYGGHYVNDVYPKPVAGFDLDASDRALAVGFVEKVYGSDELLKLSPDSGAIVRDGRNVRVLRASLKTEGGRTMLIPEQPEDAEDALVLLDVGSGDHAFVRYTVDKSQLVMHSGTDGEEGRERVLVRLKKFDKVVVASRSSQKWIFWGEEQVRETLEIGYDGTTVFFNIKRFPRKR
jgi:hypothetical protein